MDWFLVTKSLRTGKGEIQQQRLETKIKDKVFLRIATVRFGLVNQLYHAVVDLLIETVLDMCLHHQQPAWFQKVCVP